MKKLFFRQRIFEETGENETQHQVSVQECDCADGVILGFALIIVRKSDFSDIQLVITNKISQSAQRQPTNNY